MLRRLRATTILGVLLLGTACAAAEAPKDGATVEETTMNEIVSVIAYMDQQAMKKGPLDPAELQKEPQEIQLIMRCAASVKPKSIAESYGKAFSLNPSLNARELREDTHSPPHRHHHHWGSVGFLITGPDTSSGSIVGAMLRSQAVNNWKEKYGGRPRLRAASPQASVDLLQQLAPTPECFRASQVVADLYWDGKIPQYILDVSDSDLGTNADRLCSQFNNRSAGQDLTVCIDRQPAEDGTVGGIVINTGTAVLCAITVRAISPMRMQFATVAAPTAPLAPPPPSTSHRVGSQVESRVETRIGHGVSQVFRIPISSTASGLYGLTVEPDFTSCIGGEDTAAAPEARRQLMSMTKQLKKRFNKVVRRRVVPGKKRVVRKVVKSDKHAVLSKSLNMIRTQSLANQRFNVDVVRRMRLSQSKAKAASSMASSFVPNKLYRAGKKGVKTLRKTGKKFRRSVYHKGKAVAREVKKVT